MKETSETTTARTRSSIRAVTASAGTPAARRAGDPHLDARVPQADGGQVSGRELEVGRHEHIAAHKAHRRESRVDAARAAGHERHLRGVGAEEGGGALAAALLDGVHPCAAVGAACLVAGVRGERLSERRGREALGGRVQIGDAARSAEQAPWRERIGHEPGASARSFWANGPSVRYRPASAATLSSSTWMPRPGPCGSGRRARNAGARSSLASSARW